MRTARSRTSGENLFVLFMAPFSQELEPPQIPGRFKMLTHQFVNGSWIHSRTKRVFSLFMLSTVEDEGAHDRQRRLLAELGQSEPRRRAASKSASTSTMASSALTCPQEGIGQPGSCTKMNSRLPSNRQST